MANDFRPGHYAPVIWQATGGTASVLQIRDHTVDLSVMLHDVTHTGTDGVRARIAGPLDAAGTVNASLDLDLPPFQGPISLQPGFQGICAFGFTPAKFLQVPTRVEKLHFASAVDKEVTYSFDVKMDAFAGVVVYPSL